jgi:hypothetical protein
VCRSTPDPVVFTFGLALRPVLPNEWWAVAIAVGLAIAMMSALRITHPPAGADPSVVFAANPGWHYLLFRVLSGALALVLIASLYHRASGMAYPTTKAWRSGRLRSVKLFIPKRASMASREPASAVCLTDCTIFSGTPTAAGTFTFLVAATNSYALSVSAPAPCGSEQSRAHHSARVAGQGERDVQRFAQCA